jgi:hypothetical protein
VLISARAALITLCILAASVVSPPLPGCTPTTAGAGVARDPAALPALHALLCHPMCTAAATAVDDVQQQWQSRSCIVSCITARMRSTQRPGCDKEELVAMLQSECAPWCDEPGRGTLLPPRWLLPGRPVGDGAAAGLEAAATGAAAVPEVVPDSVPPLMAVLAVAAAERPMSRAAGCSHSSTSDGRGTGAGPGGCNTPRACARASICMQRSSMPLSMSWQQHRALVLHWAVLGASAGRGRGDPNVNCAPAEPSGASATRQQAFCAFSRRRSVLSIAALACLLHSSSALATFSAVWVLLLAAAGCTMSREISTVGVCARVRLLKQLYTVACGYMAHACTPHTA